MAQAEAEVVELEDVGGVDVTALVTRVRAALLPAKGRGFRPPLPPKSALKIMSLARAGSIDLARAAALFEAEPVLSASVLRVARSPLFGGADVPTIKDALVRIGTRRLHDVVLEAALEMKVFRSARFGLWMQRIQQHSVAVAHTARAVARALQSASGAWARGCVHVDAEQAFFVGLVHDVGAAVVLAAVEAGKVDVARDALAFAMDELHLEVGAVVAEAWGLAPATARVVAGHHRVATALVGMSDAEVQLLAVLIVAEVLALRAGFDVLADARGPLMDPVDDDDVAWAMATLGLGEAHLNWLYGVVEPMLALLASSE